MKLKLVAIYPYRSTNKAVISPGTTINGEEMETAQPSTAGTSEQAALLGYLGWAIDQFSRSVNSLGNNQSLSTPLMVANRRKGRPEPGWQYWHRAAPPLATPILVLVLFLTVIGIPLGLYFF